MKDCKCIGDVLEYCISIMEEEQKVLLYESFNGGTYDNASFKEWIENLPLAVYGDLK